MDRLYDILKKIIPRSKLLTEAIVSERISSYWPQIATGDLSKHTRVKDYKSYVLYLEVSSSIWAHQLSFLKKDIIDRTKQFLPNVNIKDIRTSVYPELMVEQQKISLKTTEKKVVKNSTEYAEEVAAIVEDIKDEGLQHKLESIIKKAHVLLSNDDRKSCEVCGKKFTGSSSACIECRNQHLDVVYFQVKEYLQEAPWSKYQDIVADWQNIDENQYYLVKSKLIEKLKDKMTSLYFEHYKTRNPRLVVALKEVAFRYVSLRSGLTPDQINDNILRAQIGPKIYKMLELGQ